MAGGGGCLGAGEELFLGSRGKRRQWRASAPRQNNWGGLGRGGVRRGGGWHDSARWSCLARAEKVEASRKGEGALVGEQSEGGRLGVSAARGIEGRPWAAARAGTRPGSFVTTTALRSTIEAGQGL